MGINFEVFDGLIGTVETLIANPHRPELALVEIIDTFRDAGIQVLDLSEDIIFMFLDVVVAAIELLQDLLNFEIRIPFISRLFKLIGAGKLTILNMTSLLAAIPATVISKLIFGEAPVQEFPAPEFPQQVAVSESTLLAVQSVKTKPDLEKTRKKMQAFGGIAIASDLINGILRTKLDFFPEVGEEDVVIQEHMSLALSCFSWLGSFPGSKVEPGGYPYDIANKKHRVSKDDEEQMYWERVLWGWRTGMLGIDIIYMAMAHIAQAAGFPPDKFPRQRLSRANDVTIYLTFALSLVNIGLTGRFLHTIKKEDDRGRKIANEISSFMPDTFAVLRAVAKDDKAFAAMIALSLINVTSTSVTTAFNIRFLKGDIAALKEDL